MISSFVINLKHRSDRLCKFMDTYPLDNNNLVIFEAFNGHKPELSKYYETYCKLISNCKLRKGELGCFISHFEIWKYMIENDIQESIVYEDDAHFSENYKEKLENVLSNLPDDYHLVYLGGRFQPNHITSPAIRINDTICSHDISKKWVGTAHDRTTHAYLISIKLAKLFVDDVLNNFDGKTPVDHYMTRFLERNNFPIYSSQPLICYSPRFGDSDIR